MHPLVKKKKRFKPHKIMKKALLWSRSFFLRSRTYTFYVRQRSWCKDGKTTIAKQGPGSSPTPNTHKTHHDCQLTLPQIDTCSNSLCFPPTQAMSKSNAVAKKSSSRARRQVVAASGAFTLFHQTSHLHALPLSSSFNYMPSHSFLPSTQSQVVLFS